MAKIIENKDFWTIPNVRYRSSRNIYTTVDVDLSKELVLNLSPMRNASSIQKGDFHAESAPFQYAVLKAARQSENKEIREFLKRQFSEYRLSTRTKVAYQPYGCGKDKVVHNYGTSKAYDVIENITGNDGFVDEIKDKKYLEALLGASDIKEINDVFKWITGKKAYIMRRCSAPCSIIEYAVEFNEGLTRVGLDSCGDTLIEDRPSLGMRESAEALVKNTRKIYSITYIKSALNKEGISGELEKRILGNL